MSNSILSTAVPNSNPQFIGFNLADFSLTPVVRKGKGKELTNTKHRHEWTGITQGKTRNFFIERSYGHVAPNAYTEDFLLLLAALAYQRDNPSKIPVSATSLLTVQGYTSLPGGNNIQRVFDHLDALSETRLHTNALYDRDKSQWYAFKGAPVGGFTYVDNDGKLRTRTDKDGNKIEVVVRELGTASITPEFYDAFLIDCISLDLTKYFNVGGPTARRLYKMGMKYIQTLGDFELDLQECCVARLGMLPEVVLSKKPSALARDIKPETRKVTESEDLTCVVEKSKTSSGYKICFRKNVTQIQLPGIPAALQGSEKKAYGELRKRAVNKKLAYDYVIEARRRHGRRAERFISFVLRAYDRDHKAGKVGAGVLKERILNPLFFDPAFADYLQALRIKEGRKDSKRYAEGALLIGDLFEKTTGAVATLEKEHPAMMKSIRDKVEAVYSRDSAKELGFSKPELATMKERALVHYAERTLTAFRAGDSEFRPF